MRKTYPESLIPDIVSGKARPKNGRILVKAVTWSETDEMAAKIARIRGVSVEAAREGMDLEIDTSKHVRTAPYHEIVAVAPDVEDPDYVPGALILFVTAAADFAQDKKYVFVKASHIIACEACFG